MNNQRQLYNDGWNSVAHAALGVVAASYTVVLVGFLSYQLVEYYYHEDDFAIDLTEFMLPFLVTTSMLGKPVKNLLKL